MADTPRAPSAQRTTADNGFAQNRSKGVDMTSKNLSSILRRRGRLPSTLFCLAFGLGSCMLDTDDERGTEEVARQTAMLVEPGTKICVLLPIGGVVAVYLPDDRLQVSGEIVCSNGAGLSDATVTASGCPTCSTSTTHTHTSGAYVFDPPDGDEPVDPKGEDTVRIQVSRPGYRSVTVYLQPNRPRQRGNRWDVPAAPEKVASTGVC